MRKLKDRADRHLGRREYRKAERLFRELVRLEPSDARLHVRLGEVLRRRGEPEAAARAFADASRQLARQGQRARALAARNMALALDPSLPLPAPVDLPTIVVTPAYPEASLSSAPWPAQEQPRPGSPAGVILPYEGDGPAQAPAPPSPPPDLLPQEDFEAMYGPIR